VKDLKSPRFCGSRHLQVSAPQLMKETGKIGIRNPCLVDEMPSFRKCVAIEARARLRNAAFANRHVKPAVSATEKDAAAGAVLVWGANFCGQLGLEAPVDQPNASAPPGLEACCGAAASRDVSVREQCRASLTFPWGGLCGTAGCLPPADSAGRATRRLHSRIVRRRLSHCASGFRARRRPCHGVRCAPAHSVLRRTPRSLACRLHPL
jgi:hypothetical protein